MRPSPDLEIVGLGSLQFGHRIEPRDLNIIHELYPLKYRLIINYIIQQIQYRYNIKFYLETAFFQGKWTDTILLRYKMLENLVLKLGN